MRGIWTRSVPHCPLMSHPQPFQALGSKSWSVSTLFLLWIKRGINMHLSVPSSHSHSWNPHPTVHNCVSAGKWSHGTAVGQLESIWEWEKLGQGPPLPLSRDTACKRALLPWEKANRRHEKKEGSSIRPMLPLSLLQLHEKWEALALLTGSPSHLQGPPVASFPLSSTSSHTNGFVRSTEIKQWAFSVEYFKIIRLGIWKLGTVFSKKSAFSEDYRKIF